VASRYERPQVLKRRRRSDLSRDLRPARLPEVHVRVLLHRGRTRLPDALVAVDESDTPLTRTRVNRP
jgi:hypothetical protein